MRMGKRRISWVKNLGWSGVVAENRDGGKVGGGEEIAGLPGRGDGQERGWWRRKKRGMGRWRRGGTAFRRRRPEEAAAAA